VKGQRIDYFVSWSKLESSVNPDVSYIIKDIERGKEIHVDQANFALFSTSPSEVEPTSFHEAWNHPDPKNRELWRFAINKELGKMENKNVLEIISKEDVPEGRRTIHCKWILNILI
jgi:hypothetical protein